MIQAWGAAAAFLATAPSRLEAAPDAVTVKAALNEAAKGELETFHSGQLQRLRELKLDDILARKNPYLFRAKGLTSARAVVQEFLDAHLSS